MKAIADKVGAVLARDRAQLKTLLERHGEQVIDQVTAEQVCAGARGIKSFLCSTSEVPPEKGLIIRGRPIGELVEISAEEVFYLLLTGSLPEASLVQALHEEFNRRADVPAYVWNVLEAMPTDAHPMCMLNTALLVQQNESTFARRYAAGMSKDEFWEATLDDALTLLARLPIVAAAIYRKRFAKGPRIAYDPTLNWSGNYAKMLGLSNGRDDFAELMRLYLVLHSDHGGGNASAATAATVNSTLADLYYSLSAGLNALAGPLHGLANQECLGWILDTMNKYNGVPTVEQITQYAEETIASKRVIPGYGHAVLRAEDPRFSAFIEFGKKRMADDPVFRTVLNVFEAVPIVLQRYPKIKNPWPNVDAASGATLQHYGLKEQNYYTVLFGVSRGLGICAQAILARGMGQPLIRPSAVTLENLIKTLLNK